jgi:L-iditol 2-dehydrogenase
VVLHALRRAQLQPGHSVFVIGTGSIGILACSLAKALGASRVAAADINRARLGFTKSNGMADDVFHIDISKSNTRLLPTKATTNGATNGVAPAIPATTAEENIRRSRDTATEALHAFGEPDGFDIVMECTGVESSAQMGVFVRCFLFA